MSTKIQRDLARQLLTLHAQISDDPDAANVAFEQTAIALAKAVLQLAHPRAATEPR